MDSDLMLVIGIVLGALSIPSLLNAFSSSRPPRLSVLVLLVAAGLIVFAVKGHSGGYSPSDLPDVFGRVFRRLTH